MKLVLEKDNEVKEGLRIKKRMDQDYDLLRGEFFKVKKERDELEDKVKALLVKRQNIEN